MSQCEIPGFPLDQAQHTGPCLAVAEHRVPLPMAHHRARLARPGARRNRALARQPAAAVVAPIALAAPLPRPPQMHEQGATGALVSPDVAVDRLMADPEL